MNHLLGHGAFQMFFERLDVMKVLAMIGCLLSITVIASIILNGNQPPL
jgi:hypothetical protein